MTHYLQKKSIPTEPNGPIYLIQTTGLKSTYLSRGIMEVSLRLRSTKRMQAETSEAPRANSTWRSSEDLPPTHARVMMDESSWRLQRPLAERMHEQNKRSKDPSVR